MPRTKNGFELHTLSYLKRITGRRAQATGVPHVLALAPEDAARLEHIKRVSASPTLQMIRGKSERYNNRFDMRSWRPVDGWAISSTDGPWLDIPDDHVIVFRSNQR